MSTCIACGAENPEGFHWCGMCGASLAVFRPERRKMATLLFCDMSGSTAIGERIDAESVRDLMFRYFDTLRSVLERHGGTVEKFIGDAVVAVFGVPIAHEEDALRAVRAATEIRGRVADLNAELKRHFGVTIALRMGVNTGEVVTGGSSAAASVVTGDTVNVAARLEQAAAPGEILLGELTYRLVRGAVTADPVDPIAAKGKARPVPAYRLLSIGKGAPAAAGRLEVLVGRAGELAALERLFGRAVRERRCLLAPIVGEPGVGKSRLVGELSARVAGRARVVTGRCLSYGEGITFWPLAEIVRDAAGITDEHSPQQARERIGRIATPEVAARVAAIVGLGGEIAAAELGWAVRQLFEELARDRPLVIIVEDAHWAEPLLLDLLEQVVKSAEASMLLLCPARPELLRACPDWRPAVRLEPLGDTDARRLAQRLAEQLTLPAELASKVAAVSGGNPLFAEELAITLSEDPGASLPTSLSAVLTARLDRLPDEERAAAERASVEGELFHRGAVTWLSPERARVARALDGLAGQELIRPARAEFAGELAYRFKHALVRDVAYNGTPKKLRAGLHERFAAWLERAAGPRLIEYEEILGYHLEQAHRYLTELGPPGQRGRELARQAAGRLTAAGRRAAARGDAAATVNLLTRAAALLPSGDRGYAVLLAELADAHLKAGEFERAGAVAIKAGHRAQLSGDRALQARSSLVRLQLQLYVDPEADLPDLHAKTTQAIETLTAAGDDAGLADGWTFSAYLWLTAAQAAKMEAAIDHATEHARRAGDRRAELDALFLAPMINYFGPRPRQEGIVRCRELLARSGGARHVDGIAFTAWGLLEGIGGHLDQGRRLVRRGEEMLAQLGLGVFGLPQASGELELIAGDPAAAERILRPTFDQLQGLGETGIFSTTAALLAEAVCQQGRDEEALGLAETARKAAQPGDVMAQAGWRQVRARALARRGERGQAQRLVREAIALTDSTDFLTSRAYARVSAAEVLRLIGQAEEATELLAEASDLFEQKGNLVEAERARAERQQTNRALWPLPSPSACRVAPPRIRHAR